MFLSFACWAGIWQVIKVRAVKVTGTKQCNDTFVYAHTAVSQHFRHNHRPGKTYSYRHAPSSSPHPPALLICFFSSFLQSPLLSPPPSCPCLKHLCQLCLSLLLSSSLTWRARLTSSPCLLHCVLFQAPGQSKREACYYHNAHNHCRQQMHFQAVCVHIHIWAQHEALTNRGNAFVCLS